MFSLPLDPTRPPPPRAAADAFQDSEIILQIMGFNPGEGCSASKVFFVVQFYHFPAMRSQCRPACPPRSSATAQR